MIYSHYFTNILWVLVVFCFVFWFFKLYLKKQIVSVLSMVVLMKLFVPLIFMYPFAFSVKNSNVTGYFEYLSYQDDISKAFVISVVGILAFVIGSYFATKLKSKHKVNNTLYYSYRFLLNKINIFLFFICLVGLFLLMYQLGFFDTTFFGGRSYAMENSNLRPISNFFYAANSIFLMLALTYFYINRSKFSIILVVIGFLFSLSNGTRASALNSILIFIFMHFTLNTKPKNNLMKLFVYGVILLVSAMYIGDLRHGQYNILLTVSSMLDSIFYGNNFSDLRDFSWVLAYWDQQFQYGKTMIAGYLSMIPSYLFPLRTEWGLGTFTVSTIGYDTSVHPGLRPGIFGEAYFNFGYIGVVIFGFIYGFFVNKFNIYVIDSLKGNYDNKEKIIKVSMCYLVVWTVNFMISAGFFNTYVLLFVLFIGYIQFEYYKNKNNGKILTMYKTVS